MIILKFITYIKNKITYICYNIKSNISYYKVQELYLTEYKNPLYNKHFT